MTPDLEALVVAAYVFADEFPVPPRPGPPVRISDAELVALAVCQALMGIVPTVSSLAWSPIGCRAGFLICRRSRSTTGGYAR